MQKRTRLLEGETTDIVLRLFFRVYDRLGYGFLESVYCAALAYELAKAGIAFVREAPVDVWYDSRKIGHRCSNLEVGLLLHFGPKAAFKRLIHTNDRKPNLPSL